ncbi:MAG: hypothetical protein A3E87_03395 [Gammaproteobacteria bacterium RIFCSPHIGHO2_12_FULL_35_23]|nr:MAG: hypothetical protein A3E87_03395 [Gammaproteobacteria bacterium RIFCSPHIGHO2_12_FULL_35_23]
MFKPFSLYVGLRYTRAKKRSGFVSFISLMSMLGIALGVMVLITVLSVMNGFDQQIREKLFILVPHITINSSTNVIDHWQRLEKKIKKNKSVTSVVPIVTGQALLTKDGATSPVIIDGIIPTNQGSFLNLQNKMIEGSFNDLATQKFSIILGADIAANLGVVVGDTVDLVTPTGIVTPVGIVPRFRQYKVVGVFRVGSGFGFDNAYAFMSLSSAQALFMLGKNINSLQLRIKDLFSASQVAWQLQQQLGDRYTLTDWTQQFGAFYHAVQMEKTMMFFILLLIIAVAAFNLVSSLMMGVNDKAADIAILRTFGATPATIMKIFIIQGGIIGAMGTLLGVIGGVILSLNITAIVNLIQNTFNVQFLNSNIYFVDFLPSQLQLRDVTNIAAIAFGMSLLATIYPAWRASKVQPAEALRYE